MIKTPTQAILECTSDDVWVAPANPDDNLPTFCIESPSLCPTSQAQVDGMFDAGTGGSWDVTVNGGSTDVSLMCTQGNRPEYWGKQVATCNNGVWTGDLTRCIEDKDYCMDGHPHDEDKAAINGWWVCTKTTGTGAQVVFQHEDRKRRDDSEGADRGYAHTGHWQESSWSCELKCDDGFQAIAVRLYYITFSGQFL